MNVLGQEIASVVNKDFLPGKYQQTWDAGNLSSGIYFYRIEAEGYFIQVKKMVLIK